MLCQYSTLSPARPQAALFKEQIQLVKVHLREVKGYTIDPPPSGRYVQLY
jgi:hypothetical protein